MGRHPASGVGSYRKRRHTRGRLVIVQPIHHIAFGSTGGQQECGNVGTGSVGIPALQLLPLHAEVASKTVPNLGERF